MKENMFKFLPETEATNPTKGTYFRRIADSWWVVHPEKGLVFFSPRKRTTYGMPQCNTNESITRKIANDGMYEFPYEVKKIALVWAPVDVNEFRD